MYAVSEKSQEAIFGGGGNARFIDSLQYILLWHVAQAALIMLWAGVFTLFELSVYSADAPLFLRSKG